MRRFLAHLAANPLEWGLALAMTSTGAIAIGTWLVKFASACVP